MDNYIGCAIKRLPDDTLHSAMRTAIAINPANQPNLINTDKTLFPINRIAVVTTKFWGPKGVHLTVGFLNPNTPAALQDKILSHMNAWNKSCNASFAITSGAPATANVRISLGGGGYWSYLGTDILHIPSGQPTMNLERFSLSTPESEYHRVVRHETGHTLGCPHEHMRQEIINHLDKAKTEAYFLRTQNWQPQETDQQVLTPISELSLMGASPHAETDSIMCYALPASITVDNTPIVGGVDITADDGTYMGKLYPLAIINPPPPPTPPTPTDEITINITSPGQYKLTKVN